MLPSLFDGLMKSWSGRRVVRSRGESASPWLEALEDRCVPTSIPSLPTPDSLPPILVASNVMAVAQPRTDAQVVFLGDSIVWAFAYEAGAPAWSALSGVGTLADYGVIGQTTQGVLYQIGLGQFNGIAPGVVVLTIGTNDLVGGTSPQDTAAGILADVGAIHFYAPQAQVLVVGVPPGGFTPSDPYRQATNQTDALVSQGLVGDSRATFINLAPALEGPDGQISALTLYDSVHPSALGYAQISAALAGPIQQALQQSVPQAVLG